MDNKGDLLTEKAMQKSIITKKVSLEDFVCENECAILDLYIFKNKEVLGDIRSSYQIYLLYFENILFYRDLSDNT